MSPIKAFFFFLLCTNTPLRGIFWSLLHLLCLLQSSLHHFSLHFLQNRFSVFASFRECCYFSILLLLFLPLLSFSSRAFLTHPKASFLQSQIFLALFALPSLVVLPYRPSPFYIFSVMQSDCKEEQCFGSYVKKTQVLYHNYIFLKQPQVKTSI